MILVATISLSASAAFNGGYLSAQNGESVHTTNQNAGGYTGPSIKATTVSQAKKMSDDTYVTLQGKIIKHLGKDKYLFKDNTGEITIEIDHDKWRGETAGANDQVEIHGEVDKDWSSIKIDVDTIRKL